MRIDSASPAVASWSKRFRGCRGLGMDLIHGHVRELRAAGAADQDLQAAAKASSLAQGRSTSSIATFQ